MPLMIHGQRGRAGGDSRLPPAGTTAGPASAPRMIGGFTFAVQWPREGKSHAKRAKQIVLHVEGQGAAVAGEQVLYGRQRQITVAVWPLVTLAEAERIAATCPWVMPGSLEVLP
jgi:hypothetical protein